MSKYKSPVNLVNTFNNLDFTLNNEPLTYEKSLELFEKNGEVVVTNNLKLVNENVNTILQTYTSLSVISSSFSDTSLNAITGLTSNLLTQLQNRLTTYNNDTGLTLTNPKMYIGSATSSSSATTSVTFNTAFTTLFCIIINPINLTGATNRGIAQVTSSSTSGFSFEVRQLSNVNTRLVADCHWYAIGV
jgi:hypothetical protein